MSGTCEPSSAHRHTQQGNAPQAGDVEKEKQPPSRSL